MIVNNHNFSKGFYILFLPDLISFIFKFLTLTLGVSKIETLTNLIPQL